MHEIPLQRVAAIHDLSGFGRASLTVVIPILASMGVQTCPLPTAVLSSQTSGVEGFTFHDLTAEMGPMLDHWQRMGLSFDAVYSGFLGNPLQLEIAARCIGHFLKPGGFALVDPVLGDNGTLDPTQTPEMVEAMRQLIGHAHVITPNLTEAAFLLDEPYRLDISPDGLKELQALHHRVGVCLEQLAVILAEKDLEKRRALCNTLNNEREAILRDSYELTLRHMERVSRGLSGAIDTSALHLELQSLFNRIVGIIGSAASMDYGTPNDPEPQG